MCAGVYRTDACVHNIVRGLGCLMHVYHYATDVVYIRRVRVQFSKVYTHAIRTMMMRMVLFCLSKRTPLLNGLGFSRYAKA